MSFGMWKGFFDNLLRSVKFYFDAEIIFTLENKRKR